MEGRFLSPAEQQYYPELFSKSDKESSGRVAAQRAMSLFRLSPQLSDDVIQRINELCGAGRLGYYGRSQFYCALKMIAMVQNGLPLPNSVDFVMQAGIEVPLPEFGDDIASPRPQTETDPNSQMEFVNPAFNIADTDFTLGDRKGSTLASVPPLKPTRPANSNPYIQSNSSPTNITQPLSSPPVSPSRSSPSFPTLPVVSPARTSGSLERNQSLPVTMVVDVVDKDVSISRLEKQTSAPPAPTLSKTEEGWASFEKTVEEEEEVPDTSWTMYTGAVSPSSSCSSISAPASSHHTSESPIDRTAESQEGDVEEDEEDDDDDDDDEEEEEDAEEEEAKVEKGEGEVDEEDMWSINKEQREYYSNQFKMLQPDPTGLLPGGDAKGFFEKSKLPTAELSTIWQLSDVNKDGTLSLEEFCTAMHLVVLRKHDIPLPEELPQCLIPKIPTVNGDGPVPVKQTTPVPIPGSHAQPVTTTTIHPIQPHAHTGRSVTPPSSGSEMKNADDNWATFVDSPFPGPPSPSSQPPVSFDFASISPDPDAKIFQPIALHLSPDGKPVQPDTENPEARPRTFSDPVHPDESEENSIVVPSPIKPRAMTITSSTDHTPAKIAPPPEWGKARAKFGSEKSSSMSSPRPVIPPRPTAQQVQQSKTLSMDISSTEHDFADFSKFEAMKAKSSSLKMDRRGVSLDYNNRMQTEQTFPPIPPPRPSASEEDLVEGQDGKLSPHNLANKERHLSGDPEAADKKREQFSKDRKRHLSAPVHLGVAEIRTGDRKSVQARIRQEKEENTKLSRHNSEMQQELRTLTDQRLALEISLERLRPFTSAS